jgi:nicotinate-nucleotide adenylyltransferase
VIALPPHAPGMRIGLYGGSFNPPHAAHLMVSRRALRMLRLDRVWWLVTPGNPLKPREDLKPLNERLKLSRELIDDSRIIATGIEAELGTHFTVDTVDALQRLAPGVRFVWLMGADNLAQFGQWRDWQTLAARVPLAVIDRPGFTHRALRGKAAVALARHRIDESDAALLADIVPPAWTFLHGPRSSLSSSAIRAKTSRK